VVAAATGMTFEEREQEEREMDIRRLEERESWYAARFIAEDAPEWNICTFVGAEQLANGLTMVELDIEVSRERICLKNAYRHIGQIAQVRVNSGQEHQLRPCSAPFPLALQEEALYRAKGDMEQGEIKTAVEATTVISRLQLLVPDGEAQDLVGASAADTVEIGPFKGTGLNLRTPIINVFGYRTVIIMAEGTAIATAKALIEAGSCVCGLNLAFRESVRLYYRAPNDASVAFKPLFESWEKDFNCKVLTATREQFIDVFDGDDDLEYEPATTAAVILTNGDEAAEKSALLVCTEAEITEIVKDSEEAPETEYRAMRTHQAHNPPS